MITKPKVLVQVFTLISILMLAACGQATAAPAPVEEMTENLALFSATDIVPTWDETQWPRSPTPTDAPPTTTPTLIEHSPLPPGLSTTPTDAALPPTPAEGSEGTTASGFCDPALEVEAIEAINRHRVDSGAGPLVVDERLNEAARRYSQDMGVNGVWNHIGSDGSGPFKRIHDAGYTYTSAAENISAGHNRGRDAVEAWMDSDGHRTNMLEPGYVHIGISCYHIPDDTYTFYWAAVFAAP